MIAPRRLTEALDIKPSLRNVFVVSENGFVRTAVVFRADDTIDIISPNREHGGEPPRGQRGYASGGTNRRWRPIRSASVPFGPHVRAALGDEPQIGVGPKRMWGFVRKAWLRDYKNKPGHHAKGDHSRHEGPRIPHHGVLLFAFNAQNWASVPRTAGLYSTSRMVRRRFMRSRARTTSSLSRTVNSRCTVCVASRGLGALYSPRMRLASSIAFNTVSSSGVFMASAFY
jgi:hypothetical protein